MTNYLAQAGEAIGQPLGGIGSLGSPGADAPGLFDKVISGAIGIMTIVAAVWFVLTFFTGAFAWISSGGDKAKLEMARKKIINGLVGIIIIILAIFIVDFVGNFLGFDILNPAALLENIAL